MKNSNRGSLANPFLIWTDLLIKTNEIFFASIQVIGHRMCRLAAAGAKPDKRDSREFTLMGEEKIEAVAESTQAMIAQMMKLNQLGTKAVSQMITGAMSIMSLATSRTAKQFRNRQAKLTRKVNQSTSTVSLLSASTARVLERGLQPIHSRATANAKRLGKSKK